VLSDAELLTKTPPHRAVVIRAAPAHGELERIEHPPEDHADYPHHWHSRYWRRVRG
jgi:hypothetical protein